MVKWFVCSCHPMPQRVLYGLRAHCARCGQWMRDVTHQVTDTGTGSPQPADDSGSEEIRALPCRDPGRGPRAADRRAL